MNIQHYGDVLQQLSKPKPVKEGVIVKACIDWLFMHGCYVWRNNTGAWKPKNSRRPIYYGKKGSGDIIGLTQTGRFITVECKAGDNEQRDSQIEFQRRIEDKNGIYILAYSVDDLIRHQNLIMGA